MQNIIYTTIHSVVFAFVSVNEMKWNLILNKVLPLRFAWRQV